MDEEDTQISKVEKKSKTGIYLAIAFGVILILGIGLFLLFPSDYLRQNDLSGLNFEGSSSRITLEPIEVFNGWKVTSITGNESVLYNVNIDGDEVCLIPKFNGTKQNDESYFNISKNSTVLKYVNYTQPASIKFTSLNDSLKDITLPKLSNKFCYTLDRKTSLWYKFGEQSVIIEGDTAYDSIDTNITQETGFAHLNISNNNIVGYWSLDSNVSATTVFDYSEYNNDGTINGAVFNESGVYGGSYHFDAPSSDIIVSDSASLDFGNNGEFSFSLWFLADVTPSPFSQMLGKRSGGNGFRFWLGTDGYLDWRVYGDITNTSTSTTQISAGDGWHYIVGTRNKTGGIELYVDGVSEATATGVTGNLDNAFDLFIGSDNGGAGFNGSLDEVMILSVALNSSQVLDIYNNQSIRFHPTGTQLFNNTNVSSDGLEDTCNITLSGYQNYMSTNISAKFNSGGFINFSSSGTLNDLSFIGDPNYLNITLQYHSDGSGFYSPSPIGNITLDCWEDGAPPVVGTTPNVSLLTPINNTNFTRNNVNFSYLVIDADGDNMTVDLILDGIINITNTTVANGTTLFNTIFNIPNGFHNWSVNVSDGTNTNISEQRVLNVNNFTALDHLDIEIAGAIVDSNTYVIISNTTINLSQARHLTFKGSGQLEKFTTSASTDVSMRLRIDNQTLFDEEIRTLTGLNDVGVYNIPMIDTNVSIGEHSITVEVKEDGSGSINISSFELSIDDINTITNGQIIHAHASQINFSYASTSFINLANFSINKLFNSRTSVDIKHDLVKTAGGGDTQPTCYLENNVTGEQTLPYTVYLPSSNVQRNSGTILLSQNSSGPETWQLFCLSSDTDTIENNVTAHIMEFTDNNTNVISADSNFSGPINISGSDNVIGELTNFRINKNGQFDFIVATYIQSLSGAQDGINSPTIKINTTTTLEPFCQESLKRSLADANDVGAIKFYGTCTNLSIGEFHNFTILADVTAGNQLQILNTTFMLYETDQINSTAGILIPIPNIIIPGQNDIVKGTMGINYSSSDLSDTGWKSNVSILNIDGSFNQTVLLDTTNQNHTNTTFDTTTLPDGKYITQVMLINVAGFNFENHNFSVNNEAPIINLTSPPNGTITNVSSQNITAILNDTVELENSTLYIYNQSGLYNQTTVTFVGSITQKTLGIVVFLVDGIYNWWYEATDISNNINTTQDGNFTITIDTTAPTFDNLANQTTLANSTFFYDLNATDIGQGLGTFALNDTSVFNIGATTGFIINGTTLTTSNLYNLEVTINDTLGNLNTGIFWINVTANDTAGPLFDNLINHTQVANLSFAYDLNATDPAGISSWTLNDTSTFNINVTTGNVFNITDLDFAAIFWLNVSVNDTLNNTNSGVFFINITNIPLPSVAERLITNLTEILADGTAVPLIERCFVLKYGTVCFNESGWIN